MSSHSPSANVKKHNVVKLEAVDWEFEFELGSNKVIASGAYQDDYDNWWKRMPSLGSEHPDVPPLLLKKIKGKRKDGWLIDVTLSYESHDPDLTYPGREKQKIKRYTIEPGGGEEPLLTFAKLKDLDVQSQEALGELLGSSRTRDDFARATAAIGANPLALFALEKIRKGIDAYRHSGIVWVERFSTSKLEDMECGKFYTIETEVPGSPPPLAEGANWLYIPGSATPHDNGKTWDMERRWEASLPGGWDEWFYARSPEAP